MATSKKETYAVSHAGAPTTVRSLDPCIRNLESGDGLALRCCISMGPFVVNQILRSRVIRCGSVVVPRRHGVSGSLSLLVAPP